MSLPVPRIGMRNIKTAISVFCCLLLYTIIGREDPFFACVAALICIQSSIENSKKAAIDRMLGTFIGGGFGILFLFIDKSLFQEKLSYILISIGIIPLIYICTLIGKGSASPISCIVFISIMLFYREAGNSYIYAINRVIDTGIGIVIAIIINKYVQKPKLKVNSNQLIDNTKKS